MSVKITGLEVIKDKLQDFSDRVQKLDGTHNIPVSELLTSDFLRSCSIFPSAEEMFKASGFKVESPEDFKAIPDDQWDVFIQKNTHYSNWEEMLGSAVKEWTKKQLSL